MVIFGAVDFTAALLRVAKFLGYQVTVCDARPVFADRDSASRSPTRSSSTGPIGTSPRSVPISAPAMRCCVLTHDAKFDVPAIVGALATRVGYIGAMGSRRTHAARVQRLLEAGVAEDQLQRIMSPIGLDIGARTPEETAVSICARDHRPAHRPATSVAAGRERSRSTPDAPR